MASSNYTSAKLRTGVSDFKYSPALKKLDEDFPYSYRKREDAHSLENSQGIGLSGSVRQKSRGSVIFEDDASSLRLGSHDRLSRDSGDFSSDINSERPKFLKSSLGSRRFGLQESDQLHSLGEEEKDLRLKLQLNTETNYSSPRYERSIQHGITSDSSRLDSARKSQAERRSDLLGLQSSLTPRDEVGHITKKSLRLPIGLDKEGSDSFRDNASLRSSVRFSDEVDSRARLARLEGDRKYGLDLRDGLSSTSPRVKSKESLENLGSEVKFRNSLGYEEKNQRLPRSSSLRDQDCFDINGMDKKGLPSRSSLMIREDPFAQSRSYRQEEDVSRSSLQPKDNPRSYSFKSRTNEDFDKFPDGRYSDLGSEMDSAKFKASLGHQINGEKSKLGDVALDRREASQSRLLTHSSRDTDLDWDKTSKLKWNKTDELNDGQKSYSSPRISDSGVLKSRNKIEELYGDHKGYSSPRISDSGVLKSRNKIEELYGDHKGYSSPRISDSGVLKSRNKIEELYGDHKGYSSPRISDSGVLKSRNKIEELYGDHKGYSSPRTSELGALRSRDVSDIRSELSSRSPRELRPSDVEQKKLLIEKEFDVRRDQDSQLLTGAERRSILNQDHRLSLNDSRSLDLNDQCSEAMDHSYRKPHDSELGGLRRSALLDDNMGNRRRSLLLGKDHQAANENNKVYENLGRNSEFDVKEARDIYGSRRKELTQDFLSAKRCLSKPSLRLMADITGTKYKIVERLIQMAGFSIAASKDVDFSLIWNDSFVSLEKISALGSHQRINHFAGMGEIGNRSCLVRNMARLKSRFPNDYGFSLRSWVCPEDADHFQAYYKDLKRKGKKKIYITKPIIKSKETRIRLFADAEKIPVSDPIVIEEYLNQPLLINKRKFHLRCFVLVTSCDPLRVYLHSNGMVCLASEQYADASETNLDQTSVHITNDGSERCSLHQLTEKLHQGRVDTTELWKVITDIIIKTLILAHPHLYQNYKLCRFTKPKEEESVCFEVLGFDFFVDKDLKPWLIKVNQSPSFSVSDDLDQEVKSGVVEDALQLVSLSLKQSRPKVMTAELAAKSLAELHNNTKDASGSKKEEKEKSEEDKKKQEVVTILEQIKMAAKAHRFGNNCGGYKQIFPPSDKNSLEKYLKLLESAHIYISGPDDKRRQEVKQFLIQREKDRLQAVIRCGSTCEGSQRLHTSKVVKIEIGEDLTARTLKAFNEMQITIPGKTEKAAAALIAKVRENWKMYKPKMAEFWFVHLDLNKREKVINIVKNKVRSIAQSTWCTADVENVGLYRIFLRLFNRLLAHHGRGLWDCFHSKRNSWEMIFTKATDAITSTEMSCCRRIVQLCCDCLCIVYICTPQQS